MLKALGKPKVHTGVMIGLAVLLVAFASTTLGLVLFGAGSTLFRNTAVVAVFGLSALLLAVSALGDLGELRGLGSACLASAVVAFALIIIDDARQDELDHRENVRRNATAEQARTQNLQLALAAQQDLRGLVLQTSPKESREDLRDFVLIDKNLRGAGLARTDLQRSNLHRSDLTDANLTRSDLTRANLRFTTLVFAHLDHATLRSATLRGANLNFSILTGADLRGADLRGGIVFLRVNSRTGEPERVSSPTDLRFAADLATANLRGAKFNDATCFPASWAGVPGLAGARGLRRMATDDDVRRCPERFLLSRD
jgi:uncharacterized protein YjbI with pentapeptide repeats